MLCDKVTVSKFEVVGYLKVTLSNPLQQKEMSASVEQIRFKPLPDSFSRLQN